jgi:hypothetical protein
MRLRPPPWTEPERRRLRELWCAGATVPAIARSLGRSRAACIAQVSRMRDEGAALPYRNPAAATRSNRGALGPSAPRVIA